MRAQLIRTSDTQNLFREILFSQMYQHFGDHTLITKDTGTVVTFYSNVADFCNYFFG